MIRTLLSAAAMTVALTTATFAATVSFTATGSTGVPAGYGTDLGAATWSVAPAIVDGSVGGAFRSPYDQLAAPGMAGNADYFTVGSPGLPGSPATLTLTNLRKTFSMLWGSVDTYNRVDLCGVSGCVSVTGTQVHTAGPVNFATGNAIVNFSTDFGIQTVSFFSNNGLTNDQAAFEFALAPAPVPLPAGGVLMLGALAGLVALRRRKAA